MSWKYLPTNPFDASMVFFCMFDKNITVCLLVGFNQDWSRM